MRIENYTFEEKQTALDEAHAIMNPERLKQIKTSCVEEMTIKNLINRIAAYASLYSISGKDHHYAQVQQTTAKVMSLVDKQSSVKVIKERNGKPTIIEWQGERFTFDSQSTFRGGVKRGKAHQT